MFLVKWSLIAPSTHTNKNIHIKQTKLVFWFLCVSGWFCHTYYDRRLVTCRFSIQSEQCNLHFFLSLDVHILVYIFVHLLLVSYFYDFDIFIYLYLQWSIIYKGELLMEKKVRKKKNEIKNTQIQFLVARICYHSIFSIAAYYFCMFFHCMLRPYFTLT